jgi:hypothetical protein
MLATQRCPLLLPNNIQNVAARRNDASCQAAIASRNSFAAPTRQFIYVGLSG